MHEVVKIILFLFTFAPTFSGPPLRQECYSPVPGLPSTHPIATDWEMFSQTSFVTGMTTAQQTPLQPRPHQSNTSLYLTRPNLDYLPTTIPFSKISSFPGFTLMHQTSDRINSGAFSRTTMLLDHPHHVLAMSCWNRTLSPLEISVTMDMSFFKFKQNTIPRTQVRCVKSWVGSSTSSTDISTNTSVSIATARNSVLPRQQTGLAFR